MGTNQVWTLANAAIGDYVVATNGTKTVLGVGVIAGGYQHVPEMHYCHRRPVNWFSQEARRMNRPGWVRTVIDMARSTFEEVVSGARLMPFEDVAAAWVHVLRRYLALAVPLRPLFICTMSATTRSRLQRWLRSCWGGTGSRPCWTPASMPPSSTPFAPWAKGTQPALAASSRCRRPQPHPARRLGSAGLWPCLQRSALGRGRCPCPPRALCGLCREHRPQGQVGVCHLLSLAAAPDSEFFVKPSAAQWMLEELGRGAEWDARPNGQPYAAIVASAERLLELARPLGARHMIDVQGLVWVAYRLQKPELMSSRPGAAPSTRCLRAAPRLSGR